MANRLSLHLALTGLVALAATTSPVHAQCLAPSSIDGVWKANDGGTYRLRVMGSTIWWTGMSGDDGRTWTNVFRGTRNGNIVDGEWVDVRGKFGGRGTLKLRMSGTTFMEKIGSTGSGFGGSRWGRGGCDDTHGVPADQ